MNHSCKKGLMAIALMAALGNEARPQPRGRYDVVITEIMADPSPAVGLPEAEFVEIWNRSGDTISLLNWTLSDRTGSGTISKNHCLYPGAIAILCGNNQVSQFSPYGQSIGVTRFPSLDNAGDELVLRDASGNWIHAVSYHDSWYKNDLKKLGGWSLEMTDSSMYCAGNFTNAEPSFNWNASSAAPGGTPGKYNPFKNIRPPEIWAEHAYIENAHTLHLVTNIPLLESRPPLMNGLPVYDSANPSEPDPRIYKFHFGNTLDTSTIYEWKLSRLVGCNGNESPQTFSLKAGFAQTPHKGEIVINEILFNPIPPSEDFVELLNNGAKPFDLNKISIASRNTSGEMNIAGLLTDEKRLLYPDEYIAITAAPEPLLRQYPSGVAHNILPSRLPTLPNASGTVVLLNASGNILDELDYSEKWHHPLINNPQGVSLERISSEKETNLASNWHSAGSGADYATPGGRNSQYTSMNAEAEVFSLSGMVISPNNDGRNDFLLLHYSFPETGWMGRVVIYDVHGKLVKTIASQYLFGSSGFLRWDGINNKQQPAPTGFYIIHADCFHGAGKKIVWKKSIGLFR